MRADRFVECLSDRFGFEADVTTLWKYEQYVRERGVLLETDRYLEQSEEPIMTAEKGPEVIALPEKEDER